MLIYGEWCGAGIQKKVGLTQFPKMFVVFGMARVDGQGENLLGDAQAPRAVSLQEFLGRQDFAARRARHVGHQALDLADLV